jgi:SAM-dependent methyltransferase
MKAMKSFQRRNFEKYVEVIKRIKRIMGLLPLDVLESSATLIMFISDLKLATNVLGFIDERIKKERLLDLGCGYGYLTVLFKEALGFREAYAVDIAEDRLSRARELGLATYRLDLERTAYHSLQGTLT